MPLTFRKGPYSGPMKVPLEQGAEVAMATTHGGVQHTEGVSKRRVPLCGFPIVRIIGHLGVYEGYP